MLKYVNMFETPLSIQNQIEAEESAVHNRILLESTVGSQPQDTVDIQTQTQAHIETIAGQVYKLDETPQLPADDLPDHIDDMDMAIPMFPLAKVARTSPVKISSSVAESVDQNMPSGVEAVEANGPYVNVRFDRTATYDQTIREIITADTSYGQSRHMAGRTVQIDYSSPNIAKRLGVQHAPTTIVGEALARINQANGADVIRSNHLGDFGTPFGKVLVGLDRYLEADKLAADPVGYMHQLYVRVNKEAGADETTKDAARKAFERLESGDPEVVETWQRLRAANIAENTKLYDRLGVHFDTTVGESYFAKDGQAIVDELLEKGIAVQENGVVLVPSIDGTVPLVLRKSDGSTLYATRDLAALRYRMQEYSPDAIKYVVGAEQAGHFEAVFTVAALAKIIPETGIAEHVKLGLLADKTGKKLSSRGGMTDTFEGVLDTATATAAATLRERYSDDAERQAGIPALAEALGIGAVGYTILRRDPASNTVMTPETGAARDAGTAGYLQYTHARAASVINRSGLSQAELIHDGPLAFEKLVEWRVAKALMAYPASVKRAAETNGPHHVARALEDVAGAFSTLYQSDVSILSAETPELRRSRVAAARAVQVVLANGLNLLNVSAPERI